MNKVTCLDIQGKAWKVEASELNFRPSVYGIIIQNGQILLSPQGNGYVFPGGAIELDETICQALVREIKEETGLDVEVAEVVACKSSFFKIPHTEKYVNSVMIYYICRVVGGEISVEGLAEDEKGYVKMAEWIELDKIQEVTFSGTVDIKNVLNMAIKIIS